MVGQLQNKHMGAAGAGGARTRAQVEYMATEPGAGTHRYALLCYRQPGLQQLEPPAKRANFQVCVCVCVCVCVSVCVCATMGVRSPYNRVDA